MITDNSTQDESLAVPEQDSQVRFRRTGSERLKDGAKAFLRRVESIKARRRKRSHRDGVVISGPQTLDLSQINQKFRDSTKHNDISCSRSNPTSPGANSANKMPIFFINDSKVRLLTFKLIFLETNLILFQMSDAKSHLDPSPNYLSPVHHAKKPNQRPKKSHSNRTSPLHIFSTQKDEDSSSLCSETSQDSISGTKKKSKAQRLFRSAYKKEDKSALSDSEFQEIKNKKKYKMRRDAIKDTDIQLPSKFKRGGSLNLGKESKKYRDHLQRRSFRSRSAMKGDKVYDSEREEEVVIRQK